MAFQRRMLSELDHLDDEELIAYAVAAREAGDFEAMKEALAVLANRRLPDLIAIARLKVAAQDAEEIAVEAMGNAVLARFEGTAVGEFINLMYTILRRRIADHYGKIERSPDTEMLPDEHGPDEDDIRRRDVAISPDDTSLVDLHDVVEKLLAKLSPEHRRTVELYVFEDKSAEDTANQVNAEFPDSNPKMSVDNVHQIGSRFRKDLREELEDAENPSSNDDETEERPDPA